MGVRRVTAGDVVRMAELRGRGLRITDIAARFHVSRSHTLRLLAGYHGPIPHTCPLPDCWEERPHTHCRGCQIVVAPPPSPALCELCEREALRALMVARGDLAAAEALRTPGGEETLARVLSLAGA